jgi:ubiquinone/menaquinone biosynthesis C-methylase UbiE
MTSKEIFEWDVTTWARAVHFWEKAIAQKNLVLESGLEIGARHGGLSLFFAKRYGAKMVCSDVEADFEKARNLHHAHGVGHLVEYAQADALVLPYPESHFNFVVFKSVLGVVGRNGQPEKQQQAIAEIKRVLKPGGVLFFAENLRGSGLHQLARRVFIPWGNSWRYVSLTELDDWFSIFQGKEIRATGFFAAFVPRPEWLKTLIAILDQVLLFVPKNWRYVAHGYAQKT